MKVNKNSTIYWLADLATSPENPSSNGCDFCRQALGGFGIVAIIVLIVSLFGWIMVVPFVAQIASVSIGPALIGASIVVWAFAGWVCYVEIPKLFSNSSLWKKQLWTISLPTITFEEGSTPSTIKQTMKSIHDKICPVIEFVEPTPKDH